MQVSPKYAVAFYSDKSAKMLLIKETASPSLAMANVYRESLEKRLGESSQVKFAVVNLKTFYGLA